FASGGAIGNGCVIHGGVERGEIFSKSGAVLLIACKLRHSPAEQVNVSKHLLGEGRVPSDYTLAHGTVAVDGVAAAALRDKEVVTIFGAGEIVSTGELRLAGE